MNKPLHSSTLFLSGFVLFSAIVFAAEAVAFFGFTLNVDVGGIFDPMVKSTKISDVQRASPAANAGIKAGDQIIEIAGKPIPGAKASDLRQILPPKIGDALLLRLKRVDQSTFSVTLIAVAKPAAP
jgi:C-terminal processing protease CtpA/Prc